MTAPPMPDAALPPCPFCGGEAEYDNSDHGLYEWISCTDCGAKGPTVRYGLSENGLNAHAAWNLRAGQAHERRADAGLLAAATAVLADWDARMRGDRERYVPPRADNELDGYWSPNAAMVSSEQIANLRASIAAAKGHSDA